MVNSNDQLQLLIVDTSDNMSEAFINTLQDKKISVKVQRESDKAKLFDAIKSANWDILLLNEDVKEVETSECLSCIKQQKKQTSLFVITSKAIGIPELTIAYQKGITALVSVNFIEYSIATMIREYQALKDRKHKNILFNENNELIKRCQSLLSSSRESVAYVHDGMHVYANEAYLQKFRFESIDDAYGMPFIDLVTKSYKDTLKENLTKAQKLSSSRTEAKTIELEIVAKCENGDEFPAHLLLKPTFYNGENVVQIIIETDIDSKIKKDCESNIDSETELYNRQYLLRSVDEFIVKKKEGIVSDGILIQIKSNKFDDLLNNFGFEEANKTIISLANAAKDNLENTIVLSRLTDSSIALLANTETESLTLNELQQKWRKIISNISISDAKFGDERDEYPNYSLVSTIINGQTSSAKEALANIYRSIPKKEYAISEASQGLPSVASTILTNSVQSKSQTIDHWNNLIKDSITKNRAKLFCQPVIGVYDIETEFYDIEVRIQGDDDTLLKYDYLKKYLNNAECAIAVDKWQLTQGLNLLTKLKAKKADKKFCFTLTSFTLDDDNFLNWALTCCQASRISPSAIILNFTEHQLAKNLSKYASRINSLIAAGFKVCLSDYSDTEEMANFARQNKVNLLKLSHNLSQQARGDHPAQEILKKKVHSMHQAGCRVIATNADDSSTLSALWQHNIDLMQGEYFQKEAIEASEEVFITTEHAS